MHFVGTTALFNINFYSDLGTFHVAILTALHDANDWGIITDTLHTNDKDCSPFKESRKTLQAS